MDLSWVCFPWANALETTFDSKSMTLFQVCNNKDTYSTFCFPTAFTRLMHNMLCFFDLISKVGIWNRNWRRAGKDWLEVAIAFHPCSYYFSSAASRSAGAYFRNYWLITHLNCFGFFWVLVLFQCWKAGVPSSPIDLFSWLAFFAYSYRLLALLHKFLAGCTY